MEKSLKESLKVYSGKKNNVKNELPSRGKLTQPKKGGGQWFNDHIIFSINMDPY